MSSRALVAQILYKYIHADESTHTETCTSRYFLNKCENHFSNQFRPLEIRRYWNALKMFAQPWQPQGFQFRAFRFEEKKI